MLRLIARLLAMLAIASAPLRAEEQGAERQWQYSAEAPTGITLVIRGRPEAKSLLAQVYIDGRLVDEGSYAAATHRVHTKGFDGEWLPGPSVFALTRVGGGDESRILLGGPPPPGLGFDSGTYQAITHVRGRTYPARFVITVEGNRITGKSYWDCCPGPRTDDLVGTVEGNRVEIVRDCRGRGASPDCRQTYAGELKDGGVEGTVTGSYTGAGDTFTLQPGG